MKADLYQQITDKISAQLEAGVKPWAKPWREGSPSFSLALPHNIAGRNYRGANVPWLWAVAAEQGYSHPLWLTFKQALERGGAVRKGEKATPVFFWKFDEVRDEETGKLKKQVMMRVYSVFNLAQCDGVEVPALAPRVPATEPERHAMAEATIEATGAAVSYGGDRAFYVPSIDAIRLPERAQFKSADGFYGTAFHELGHWTGHASRLNRVFGGRFGDDAYAFEELIAELSAAFVCSAHGIPSLERDDGHASYIEHWLRVLAGDKRAFVSAAAQAQKAADFIMQGEGEALGEGEPTAIAA